MEADDVNVRVDDCVPDVGSVSSQSLCFLKVLGAMEGCKKISVQIPCNLLGAVCDISLIWQKPFFGRLTNYS
jgi:hypothetical protein